MERGMKRMIRTSSKCKQDTMYSETQPIPKQVPLPVFGAVKFPVENYLPNIMRQFHNYTVFICNTCGNLEFAVS